MATTEQAASDEPADNQLEDRTERALDQYLTVLDEIERVSGVEGQYLVVSQSGREYLVDTILNNCECPDSEYNLGPEEQCKHARRVAFATGSRPVPESYTPDDVAGQLGEHVEDTPVFQSSE